MVAAARVASSRMTPAAMTPTAVSPAVMTPAAMAPTPANPADEAAKIERVQDRNSHTDRHSHSRTRDSQPHTRPEPPSPHRRARPYIEEKRCPRWQSRRPERPSMLPEPGYRRTAQAGPGRHIRSAPSRAAGKHRCPAESPSDPCRCPAPPRTTGLAAGRSRIPPQGWRQSGAGHKGHASSIHNGRPASRFHFTTRRSWLTRR